MHIPDGFLDLRTAVTTAVLSVSGLSLALRRLRHGLPRRRVPLMGLAAAFLFAAQMLNFPVAAGTSGHLLGAVLAAILLGPSAAVVVVTAVLLVQALLFADGGVLALGANVFNMAIVAALAGYGVFRALERLLPGERGFLAAAAFASWWSILVASIACAAELSWSRVAPWGLVFPAMAGTHMLIGLGEALITALVMAAILRTRPDLLEISGRAARDRTPAGASAGRPSRLRVPAAFGLVAILGLLVFGVPFASTRPDGLERVARTLGFAARATAPLAPAPMADYQAPGFASAASATWAAALVGVLVVFAFAYALAIALAPKARQEATPGSRS
jgi:cobalt/nickel transport system permease protein